MVNPHIGTSKALLKDIQDNGWTIKKGRLITNSLKRARGHRSSRH